jgi:PPOX class probable F420-dependent enzyme
MCSLDPNDPAHAEVDARLRGGIAIWLTTVRADGQPTTTPVWYDWDGETFLLFSQPDRPKLRNIATNPKVSLHPVGAPDAEDAVTIEGLASVDRSAPAADRIPTYITKYLELIDGFGWTPAGFAADYSVPVRVVPTSFRIL